MPVCAVPGVSGIRSAVVDQPLKLFLSHHACIAASYAALPLVVLGYGFRLSQFVNGSPTDSLALPVGVMFVPVISEVNGAWFVLGVGWNGLLGLFWGLPLNGTLFWVGVRGVGGGFGYLGGGVSGRKVWGVGSRFGAGASIVRGWIVDRAMVGVNPEVRACNAATS